VTEASVSTRRAAAIAEGAAKRAGRRMFPKTHQQILRAIRRFQGRQEQTGPGGYPEEVPWLCGGYLEAIWRLRGGYAEVSEYHPTIISQGPGRSMQVST